MNEVFLVAGKVGFIGVGAMGSAIASRLVKSQELLVNDRREEAAAELVSQGATFVTAEEIARQCKRVFISLPGPAQVTELLLGTEGIAKHFTPGTVVIDTTTGTPMADSGIVDALTERGVDFVDAPIGGGVRRARAGTATLMVGGSETAFAKVSELLLHVTSDVYHVGPVGTGHAMKLVNNLINSCNRFAALEAIRLGEACGIDQNTVVDILNKSTGRNYATEYTFPQLLSGDSYKPQGFTLELMRKDIRLANELAESLEHSTPIGHLVERFTEEAIERFGRDADQSQLMAEWYLNRSE
ncbi:NAD(P)-dependent oxidoreductase [Streptomyces luomodiensis]|uniref:NAD(P)-dependent oxidoreductase n=1 Tax=Streptomyces luomodiensis TaxID=3026192 RepID=A0ABY9V692_9ACTN|nr:NAD(P)-dependent oxidoreductase [Streptomyces sp. SCA4-21]WNF00334.1 NAD(P)-dependent oxidoreductase [Streptomyces sp. SCA4-21]